MKKFILISIIPILLISCSQVKEKDADIEILKECYYIENTGVDSIIPLESEFLEFNKKNIDGKISIGTKLIDLGAKQEFGYMHDTKISRYAKVATGKYKGRKVSFDYLYLDNLKTKDIYKQIK